LTPELKSFNPYKQTALDTLEGCFLNSVATEHNMSTIPKRKPGAKLGNQNALGNKGGRPRADTKTFNLTLPGGLYQQLEDMRLEGYGTKSEILSMFMAAKFQGWSNEVGDLATGLDARDKRRR